MSCWTAWTSGSTVGDGRAITTRAAAWAVAIGGVGGSDCVDGGTAGAGGVAVTGGVAANGVSVGPGSGVAVGGATTSAAVGEAVAAWATTSAAGAVIRPAKNPIPVSETATAARAIQGERLLRKGELSRESMTGCGETATGGTGVEGGTRTAALAGTGLTAGVGAGTDGLAATVSTGSGSVTSSASTVSISVTGGAGRTDGGRGGGLDVWTARGGTVDGVGRGGNRDGRLEDGFATSAVAGGREGLRTASILRLSVGSVSLSLSRPMSGNPRTLRARRAGRSRRGSMRPGWTVR